MPLKKNSTVHVPGCGDLQIKDISFLPDPCPLPEQLKKRSLVEKERLVYAPFSGVGGIVYDKDAVYIDLGGSHYHKDDTGLLTELQNPEQMLDNKLEKSGLQLFGNSAPIVSEDFDDIIDYKSETVLKDGRVRRKVIFKDNDNVDGKEDSSGNESEDEDEEIDDQNDSDNDDEKMDKEIESEDSDHDIDSDQDKKINEKVKIKRKEANLKKKKIDKSRDSSDDESENESDNENIDSDEIDSDENLQTGKKVKVSNLKRKKNESSESSDDDSEERVPQVQIFKKKKNEELPTRNVDSHVKEKIAEALSRIKTKSTQSSSAKNDDEESYDELSEDDRGNMSHDKSDQDSICEDEEMEEIENEEEEEMNEDEDDSLRWKRNLAEKARDAFLNRRRENINIEKMVYSVFEKSNLEEEERGKESNEAEENVVGGIFHVVKKQQEHKLEEREVKNQEDHSFFSREATLDWLIMENKALLVNRFVTGKWKETEDAEEILKLNNLNDEDLYGDFEDLETGEKFEAKTADDGNCF